MKNIPIVCLLLAASTLCRAAATPDPVSALINRVVENGDAEMLKGPMNGKLGFPPNSVAISETIPHKTASDGQDHTLFVVVRNKNGGRPEPVALKFAVASGSVGKEGTSVDGYIFKADLKGNLELAFHNSGIAGHLKTEELAIDKWKVRRIFKKELELFLAQKK